MAFHQGFWAPSSERLNPDLRALWKSFFLESCRALARSALTSNPSSTPAALNPQACKPAAQPESAELLQSSEPPKPPSNNHRNIIQPPPEYTEARSCFRMRSCNAESEMKCSENAHEISQRLLVTCNPLLRNFMAPHLRGLGFPMFSSKLSSTPKALKRYKAQDSSPQTL